MKKAFFYIVILLFVLLQSGGEPVSAENQAQRIRFQITTIAEKNNQRETISQTNIEGPPGTDFNINLQTGNFKMQTRFLTDLIAKDKLKIRASLNTRRFYGNSPNNLPLYEEDSQKQTLEVRFNDTIILLPFGRNGADETLKIEIKPMFFESSEKDEPLKINFDKQLPGGEISIEAQKIPHNYEVEAILLANGEEVAKGKADCLFEEEKEVILSSNNQFFAAKVKINDFKRSYPNDLVRLNFDFYQKGENSAIINQGAGVNVVGGEFSYPVEVKNLPPGKNYELRFKVNLSKK